MNVKSKCGEKLIMVVGRKEFLPRCDSGCMTCIVSSRRLRAISSIWVVFFFSEVGSSQKNMNAKLFERLKNFEEIIENM